MVEKKPQPLTPEQVDKYILILYRAIQPGNPWDKPKLKNK